MVLTAVGTLERAKEALQAGAYDFLIKPADPDALLALVDKVGRSVNLIDTAQRSSPAVGAQAAGKILGSSPEVLTLKARLELVAASDASVLIIGESGTGKELVARALHEASGRHRQRLVTVNCAATPRACSSRRCSATSVARSRAPTPTGKAWSSWPTAGPCSSTRSASCRWACRPSCCACSRSGAERKLVKKAGPQFVSISST